jgi:hypothetical protein
MKSDKFSWQGRLTSVQPRIRLCRSFDQSSHSYLGYALGVKGTIDEHNGEFLIGIGKAAQAKQGFRVGDRVSGQSLPVFDNRLEVVKFYKTSRLKIIERSAEHLNEPPPWLGVPPDLETYRERGHRRLDARIYKTKCQSCIWGCNMPVEIIIDQWTNVIGLSLFVMARNPALYIDQVGLESYRAGKGWYGRKKTGSMSKILPTAQWMNKVRIFTIAVTNL